jgi:hypothetical protein
VTANKQPPTPAEQIAFLGNIERLLSEGQFVATYKYALLIAIADLAVQLGSDDGRELELPLRAIAEQFIELYWRHSAPYDTGTDSVLIQNSGRQASVISIVTNLQRRHGTFLRAQASPLGLPRSPKPHGLFPQCHFGASKFCATRLSTSCTKEVPPRIASL